MNAQEILAACKDGGLPKIEGVDPFTARMEDEHLVVSGRVALPLDGVAWSLNRTSDIPIVDELGATLGVLCTVADRQPQAVSQLTRYQYTALLADAPNVSSLLGVVRFSRNYLVLEEAELSRYLEHYSQGSALWGGFHQGTSRADGYGNISEIKARRGLISPTDHHQTSFRLVTKSAGPREQFLRTYHTIELLFDYVTYLRFLKVGKDLTGFGKIMSAYHQRSELERLKSIVKDFCSDMNTVAEHMARIEPFLDRAEEMFQLHGKDGNPLKEEWRWEAFRTIVRTGSVDRLQVAKEGIAKGDDQFNEFIANLAAYQVYRLRSSIAHSRIGEYLLSVDDDEMIARFGLPLLTEVANQVFGSQDLADLLP